MTVVRDHRIRFAFVQCTCYFPSVLCRLFAFKFVEFNVTLAGFCLKGRYTLICIAKQALVL